MLNDENLIINFNELELDNFDDEVELEIQQIWESCEQELEQESEKR